MHEPWPDADSRGRAGRGEATRRPMGSSRASGDAPVSADLAEAPPEHKPARSWPVFGSFLPYDRGWLSRDVIAGITLAALAIPEVMGYTKIAGTPVITGLYTILIPIVAFAVLGSSRHLVVGGDSATAAIMFDGIASL